MSAANFIDTVTALEKVGASIQQELKNLAGGKDLDDVSEDQLEAWTKEIVFNVFNPDAVSAWAENGTFGSVNARRIREQAKKILDGEPVEELEEGHNLVEVFAALIRHLPIVMFYGYRHRELVGAAHSKIDDQTLMRAFTAVYTGVKYEEVTANTLDELIEDPDVQSMVDGIFRIVRDDLDETAVAMLLTILKGRNKVNTEAYGEDMGRATSRDFLTGLAVGLTLGKEANSVRS